jgi:hypothetical protein
MKTSLVLSLGLTFFAITTSTTTSGAAAHTSTSLGSIALESIPDSISRHLSNAASAFQLLNTVDSIRHMKPKEITKLSASIGLHSRTTLETIIPEELQPKPTAAACCFPFFASCAQVSGKALGKLAIDLLLDLADGKLDGHGPKDEIHYAEDLITVVHTEIEKLNAKK